MKIYLKRKVYDIWFRLLKLILLIFQKSIFEIFIFLEIMFLHVYLSVGLYSEYSVHRG